MKKTTPSRNSHPGVRLLCSALLAIAVTTSVSAATKSSASSSSSSTDNRSTTEVKVTRATNFLGSDVMSTDGHKVGDIGDYYYDISDTPHLKYVIVVSGGVLGVGGDARAVPAAALSTDGDTVHVNLSRDDFWNVAVLPQNRSRYLAERHNVDQLDQAFNVSDSSSGQSKQAQENSNSSQANSNDSSRNPGATPRLVAFSDLRNSDVYDRDGTRVGRFVDTWMNLDQDRAPYLEISSPPESPFRVLPRQRIAVSMRQLELPDANHSTYRVGLTAAALRDSKSISNVQGIQLLQSDNLGPETLRVLVAQE